MGGGGGEGWKTVLRLDLVQACSSWSVIVTHLLHGLSSLLTLALLLVSSPMSDRTEP